MDQFCTVKNPNFQRCSCSDRIFEIMSAQDILQDASVRLAEFNENLDVVGMTANQAAAMRTATEGQLALADDMTATRGVLTAIMNAIRGEDANISGRHEALNPINLAMHAEVGIGAMDGQAIAQHNGANLYTAVFASCRAAVRADCTDASLQRAVTAYLMAIEQDCNTLNQRITAAQRGLSANVRESGAMLDLARVQHRQNINQFDATECLREVEAAVLSEQVCGPNYRKCLDNGQFLDVSTGRPFMGVANIFELQNLLVFPENVSIADQRLARNPRNHAFVTSFENRVRQFAEPALARCAEIREDVWADFLDKAMLDIRFAQMARVNEIQQGCMDFIAACYAGGDRALTQSMAALVDDTLTNQPGLITMTDALCRNYVESCDRMFEGRPDIIETFMAARRTEDTRAACRAIVRNCFTRFGGQNFVNFINPHSGLFEPGDARSWFAQERSQCWVELTNVESCNSEELIQEVFGGFRDPLDTDLWHVGVATEVYYEIINILETDCRGRFGTFAEGRYVSDNELEVFQDWCKKNGAGCPLGYADMVDITSWGTCNVSLTIWDWNEAFHARYSYYDGRAVVFDDQLHSPIPGFTVQAMCSNVGSDENYFCLEIPSSFDNNVRNERMHTVSDPHGALMPVAPHDNESAPYFAFRHGRPTFASGGQNCWCRLKNDTTGETRQWVFRTNRWGVNELCASHCPRACVPPAPATDHEWLPACRCNNHNECHNNNDVNCIPSGCDSRPVAPPSNTGNCTTDFNSLFWNRPRECHVELSLFREALQVQPPAGFAIESMCASNAGGTSDDWRDDCRKIHRPGLPTPDWRTGNSCWCRARRLSDGRTGEWILLTWWQKGGANSPHNCRRTCAAQCARLHGYGPGGGCHNPANFGRPASTVTCPANPQDASSHYRGCPGDQWSTDANRYRCPNGCPGPNDTRRCPDGCAPMANGLCCNNMSPVPDVGNHSGLPPPLPNFRDMIFQGF
ncbi:MAG: hypothetical protein FWE17_01070 [Alphaproteobacteria bacterium]|nr:hypothetical protein [Alphaproteobacteria bacterium]